MNEIHHIIALCRGTRSAERRALLLVFAVALAMAAAAWGNRQPPLHDDLVPVTALRPNMPEAEAAAMGAKLGLPPPTVILVARRGPFRRLGELPRLSDLWPTRFVPAGSNAGWLRGAQPAGTPLNWMRIPRTEIASIAGQDVADTLAVIRTERQLGQAANVRVIPPMRVALWAPGQVSWLFWGGLAVLWVALLTWHLWLCITLPDAEQGILPPISMLFNIGVLVSFCSVHPLRAAPSFPLGLPAYFTISLLAAGGVAAAIALRPLLFRLASPADGVRGPGVILLALLGITGAMMTVTHIHGGRLILAIVAALAWSAACLRYPFGHSRERMIALLLGLTVVIVMARNAAAGAAAGVETAALLFILVIARVAERSASAVTIAYDGAPPVRIIVRGNDQDVALLWRQWLAGVWVAALLWGLFVLKDCGWSGLFFGTAMALSWLCTNRRRWLVGGGLATMLLIAVIALLNVGPVRQRLAAWRHPFTPPSGLSLKKTQGWEQSAELVWAATSAANRGVGDGWGTSETSMQNVDEDFPGVLILEQGGLVAFAVVIASFLALTLAGFRAASRVPSIGTAIGATGIMIWVLSASIYSLAASVGAVPIGGVSVRGISWGLANNFLTILALTALLTLGNQTGDGDLRLPVPPAMKRNVARLGTLFIAALLATFVAAFFLTMFPSSLPTQPFQEGNHILLNPRLAVAEMGAVPDNVMLADGTPVAAFDASGQMQWEAPPEFATALGYKEGDQQVTGLLGRNWTDMKGVGMPGERAENALQAYRDRRRLFRRQSPLIRTGYRFPGAKPLLIAPLPDQVPVQRFATALAQRQGPGMPATPVAAVFLDAATGEVLASAFAPAYAAPLPENPLELNDVLETGGRFGGTPAIALWDVPRTMARPPGSAWKVVTAAAWVEAGLRPVRIFCRGRTVVTIDIGQRVLLPCWKRQGHGWESTADKAALGQGMADSCNTLFGEMGLMLGPQRQFDAWQRMDLRLATGKASVERVFGNGDACIIAASGFGQGRVITSVWEMAAVAAMPYNGGRRIYPFIALGDQKPPHQVIQPGTADLLAYCMHVTALKGSARGLSGRIDGCKTGTAQVGGAVNDAWLIGEFRTRAGRKTAFAIWAGAATQEHEGAGGFYKRAGLGHLIDGLARQ